MHNNVTAAIRTAVPYAVGYLSTLLVSNGVEVPAEAETALGALLTFLLGSAYYIVVRLAAQRFPVLEWLLGSPRAPRYEE